MLRLIKRSAAMLCTSLCLASCGSNNSSNLNIYLADAPIDQANSINITLTELDVTGDTGTYYFPFPTPITFNFYALQGGLSEFLTQQPLPTGHYTSITLYFQAAPDTYDSNITLIGDSNTYPLVIPAAAPTKFSLPVNFIIFENISASYTIDLNLRSSIFLDPSDPNQYILQPSLRAISTPEAGSITGTVATSLVTSGCLPTIYVYSGKVTPTDVYIYAPPGSVQPISSALVGLNTTTAIYNFTVSWLPAGTYTVAFTCEAGQDNPTTVDNILFTPVITATVNAGQTTFVNIN
ncbi:MAG: DUF4382 domain-containing protein [Gammaproteobacteria bacterium]